jgi:hypothetical protein
MGWVHQNAGQQDMISGSDVIADVAGQMLGHLGQALEKLLSLRGSTRMMMRIM